MNVVMRLWEEPQVHYQKNRNHPFVLMSIKLYQYDNHKKGVYTFFFLFPFALSQYQ